MVSVEEEIEGEGEDTPTHPPSKKFRGAPTPFPKPDPDSFMILVHDTQDIIVNLLDRGTRQMLAITCTEMFNRFYDDSLTTETFTNLVDDCDPFYLKNCIRLASKHSKYTHSKYTTDVKHYHMEAIAKVVSKNCNIIPFLEWFIGLFFYNHEEKILLDKKLYSILIRTFTTSGSIRGFQWMMTQPWYNEPFVFSHKKEQEYNNLLAETGNVELVNFLRENVTLFREGRLFGGPSEHLTELVKSNIRGKGRPFNWPVLFSSTDEWKAWWLAWQNDETSSGFVEFIARMGSYWSNNSEGAVWQNLYQLWPSLSAQVKDALRQSPRIDPFRLIKMRKASEFVALADHLIEMGFKLDYESIQDLFDAMKFFNLIGKESPQVMNWLWEMDRELFHRMVSDFKDGWINCVHNWMMMNSCSVVERAIGWLDAHPYDFFETLAQFMRFYIRLKHPDFAKSKNV